MPGVNRPANRASGRPASGGGASGSAGARGAILLAVAAILGIVLLQAFDTDFDGGGVGVDVGVGGSTVPSDGSSTDSTLPSGPSATTPTTVPSRTPSEVSVLVANGTGIRGLGGQTADALKAIGYNTLTAVDATKALDATSVQYAEGYEPEARAIGVTLGLPAAAVQPLNSPAVPDTQGANVIVLLGADLARNNTTTTTTA
ncbi:MAG TPA: LytR C-terminal domain-containing protein [Acidimicrobiales bacterium]